MSRTVTWKKNLKLDPKDVSDDYLLAIDWSDKLGTDTIVSADVSSDSGITTTVYSSTDTTSIILISGGEDGKSYTVTAKVYTAVQHFERSVIVPVEEL